MPQASRRRPTRARSHAPSRLWRALRDLRPSPSAVAESALIAAVFFEPLALGGVHAWALWGLLGLSALALAAVALDPHRRTLSASWPAALLFVATLLIALQCLPLPAPLLHLLSPHAAESYAFALAGTSSAQGPHPLSLDPAATGREVAKMLAYALAFLATGALIGSRRRARRLAAALAFSGLTVAGIGYTHKLLGLTELLGEPIYRFAIPRFVTTFGNSNNAAGFFVLCAPVALGLALRARDGTRRVLWGLAYLFTGAAVFLTVSRGGIASFLAGQLIFAALVLRSNAATSAETLPATPAALRRRSRLTPLAALLAVLAVGGYLAYGAIADRFEDTVSARSDLKLTGFLQSLPMIRDFPLTGIGRGAFATTSGRYLTFSDQTAEFIEDEPLQALVDLGLPGGLLLGLLLWAFLRSLRRRDLSAVECGLWAGLASLGLQNLFDFSLELAGVALPATLALGLLGEADAARSESQRGRGWPVRAVLGGLVLALPLAAWLLARSTPDWRDETNAFAAEANTLSGPSDAAKAIPVLARHPTSYVVPLAVATRFAAEHVPAATLSWANRAMYFRPNLAAAHLLAASALAQSGHRAQALLEARLFYELSGSLEGLALLASASADPSDLASAVPPTGKGLLSLAEFLAARGKLADAARVGAQAVALAPEDPELARRFGAILLTAGRSAEALAQAQRALTLDPRSAATYLALSASRSALNDAVGAEQALRDGLTQLPGQQDLVMALVNFQLARQHPELAEAALRQLGPQATSAERAQVFALQGSIYLREGRTVKAEEAYRNAIRTQPGGGFDWALIAILESESRFDDAADLLQKIRPALSQAQQADLDQRVAADRHKAHTRPPLQLGSP